MSWHDEETVGSVHVPYNWSYADASARTGASGFAAGDVGKLARQEDDNSLWMLTATTPTWVAVGSGGVVPAHDLGGSSHNADTLAHLNSKVSDATLDDSGDPRDPNAHAASHQNGGGDEVSVAGLSGELSDDQPPKAHALGGTKHTADTLANLNTKVSDATLDDSGDPRDPNAHKASHQNGGSDELSVAGLNGELADAQPPKTHASSHSDGGSDEIDAATVAVNGLMSSTDKTKLDGIEAGADVTDSTNVASAGAVMDSDFDANTMLAATTDDTPVALTVNASTFVGRKATGPISAMSASEARTILNVADGADVTGSNAPQAHASSHADGASDEIAVEALATAGSLGEVPMSDGAGGLTMSTVGTLSKIFQADDETGGLTITNVDQVLEWDEEYIKDDYYTHSEVSSPGEITFANFTGTKMFKVDVRCTVAAQSTSGGIRGNPVIEMEIDSGAGWVKSSVYSGGYVREDAAQLSANIGFRKIISADAGDKLRFVIHDTVAIEPDEATIADGSTVIIEYIDRTGTGGVTVNNLKDVGDVEAAAPGHGAKLFFDDNDSTWKQEPLPMLGYGDVICEDWAPTWSELYSHGPMIFANTTVNSTGLVGNATVSTINGVSPTAGDTCVVTDSGTLTLGSLGVTAGSVVIYTGSVWAYITPGVGGYVYAQTRYQLSTTTPLISPYTDGTDDGKFVYFDGTSNTGIETTEAITLTLPAPSGLPSSDGYLRRLYAGNFGGGAHFNIEVSGGTFVDGLGSIELKNNGEAVMLGAVNGSLAAIWVRISSVENHIQLRRAATWAATNFASPAAVPWDTQDLDGNPDVATWSSGTNPSRITIAYTGHYHFSGFANIDSTGGSTWTCEAWLRVNGTTEVPGSRIRTGNYGSEDQEMSLPIIGVTLQAGDYIEWVFDQNVLTGQLYSVTLSVTNTY